MGLLGMPGLKNKSQAPKNSAFRIWSAEYGMRNAELLHRLQYFMGLLGIPGLKNKSQAPKNSAFRIWSAEYGITSPSPVFH